MNRIAQLERLLEREDITDQMFKLYNDELNKLYAEKNEREAIQKTRRDAELKQQREEEALEKLESLTIEQVDKMYEDVCTKYGNVNGMSFDSWYKKSLKYYTIDDQYTVHARARSSKTVELVPHINEAHAKLTILKRIHYKFYDHYVRGHGFAWEEPTV